MLRSCSLALLALHGASALQVAKPAISTRRADGLRSTAILAASATDEGQASLPSSTANLVKSIVGSGVLSLPVGLAAFSSSRAALVPALALLSVAGTVSGYCFSMVARVCAATDSSSWGEAWSKSARCQSSRAPVARAASAPSRKRRRRWARSRRGCLRPSSACSRSRSASSTPW